MGMFADSPGAGGRMGTANLSLTALCIGLPPACRLRLFEDRAHRVQEVTRDREYVLAFLLRDLGGGVVDVLALFLGRMSRREQVTIEGAVATNDS
jgi:hypothetical protein